MGRYYSGDIDGKFWFGVQSSDCASRFGGMMSQPQYVEFAFTEDDIPSVELEMKSIRENLGNKYELLVDFFKEDRGYTDEQLLAIGISEEDLSEFADYGMGDKILTCLKDNAYCNFNAEL